MIIPKEINDLLAHWEKWRLQAEHSRETAVRLNQPEIARRYACIANTYSCCECNLRDAIETALKPK